MNMLENRQHNWTELQRKEEKASETKRWPEITQTSFKCFLKIRFVGQALQSAHISPTYRISHPKKIILKPPLASCLSKPDVSGGKPMEMNHDIVHSPLEMSHRREKTHVKSSPHVYIYQATVSIGDWCLNFVGIGTRRSVCLSSIVSCDWMKQLCVTLCAFNHRDFRWMMLLGKLELFAFFPTIPSGGKGLLEEHRQNY